MTPGINLVLFGIFLFGFSLLFRLSLCCLNRRYGSQLVKIIQICLLWFTLLFCYCFRIYVKQHIGFFAVFWSILFVGNPGDASSGWFTYTSDLEEDSASSGRSRSTSSVNQPIPREQAGPSNAVPAPQPAHVPPQPAAAPAAQQQNHLAAGPNNHEVVGGERVEDIARRLLSKSDNPSAMDIRLAEIQAEDLFQVKAEIINRMAILHPEGDWENRGARALENSRTLTGEESLERLYRLLDDIVQNGVHSESYRNLKTKVFLRDQNFDAQSQA